MKPALLLASLLWAVSAARAAYDDPEAAFRLPPEEREPSEDDVRRHKPEKHSWDETVIRDLDDSTNVAGNSRWTGEDRNKLSASLHVNGRYEYMSELLGFELQWLRRTENWSKLWWGGMLKQTQTQFRHLAAPRRPSIDYDGSDEQSVFSAGLGIGYRFKLLFALVDSERTFETVNVFATYNRLSSKEQVGSFGGYGMAAEYGVHRRTRTSFFWGGKFTYNLAWPTRSRDPGESQQDASISLGWYTLALEGGFFF